MNEVTRILATARPDDRQVAGQLLPLVYDELKRLAAAKMASQNPGHTLQPTALVHEAWLRLAGSNDPKFEGRTHFFFAAAEAMRHILVDHARRKQAQRRGGGHQPVDLDETSISAPVTDDQVLAVHDALEKLSSQNKLAADLVNLRFFAGLTLAAASEALNISERTADNYWAYAKSWLYREIQSSSVK